MPNPLSGPGIGLPYPTALYPSELSNAPIDSPTNKIALAPGQTLPLPAGDWYVTLGSYLVVQFLDPITNVWTLGAAPGWTGSVNFIKSDGFNCRIANLTGCPVSASIIAYGSGYVQASTTVTAVGSTSTWLPIVGGQLATTGTFSLNVPNAGAGYGVPPILLIPPPPPAQNNSNGVGGVPASGYLVIASGTIASVVITNPGAGYQVAPTCVVVTAPNDPNINTGITQGAVAFSLTGSGSICAVLCTNNGAAITPANISLTVGGAGTSASVVANVMQTITKASVTGAGTGYGTVAALLTTTGGGPNAGTVTNNPDFLGLAYRPRPAQVNLTVTNLGTLSAQAGTILDGGLFLSAPNAVISTGGLGGSLGGATIALTMGSTADIVTVQPAP